MGLCHLSEQFPFSDFQNDRPGFISAIYSISHWEQGLSFRVGTHGHYPLLVNSEDLGKTCYMTDHQYLGLLFRVFSLREKNKMLYLLKST